MAVTTDTSSRRLGAWLAFVGLFAALQYLAYFTVEESERVPEDLLYRYEAALFGVVQFGFMLGIAFLIAIGASKRELFALRRPHSWSAAIGIGFLVLISVYVLSGLVGLAEGLDPGEEQGLLPDRWQPDRAPQYAVNFVVVATFVPFVEELLFRGLGFTLLRRFGDVVAIIGSAVLFAAAHGLVEAFPIIAALGTGLGILRARTGSVIPGMVLHGLFNAIAMLAVFAQP